MNILLCDVVKSMREKKIKFLKRRIEQLADKHEYYLSFYQHGGSQASEDIEKEQTELFEMLDKLQKKNKL